MRLLRRSSRSEKGPSNTDPPKQEGEMTIDELANSSGVPVRTIRFYQSKGVLMAPEVRGRVAIYGKEHQERLALIAHLQDQGLRIEAIARLVVGMTRGDVDLNQWLGIEKQVRAAWADDRPQTMTEQELQEFLGSLRPGVVTELLRSGLMERKAGVFLIHSPALVRLGLRVADAGIDVQLMMGAFHVLQKHMGRAARELVEFFVSHAMRGHLELDKVEPLLQGLRSASLEAVPLIFARAIEDALRQLWESGLITKIPRRSQKSKL